MQKPSRLKAVWAAVFNEPVSIGSSDAPRILGYVDANGVIVSNDSAMKLSAVWACVRLISETISTMPLGIYERVGTGKRYAPNHPLNSILRDVPNPDSVASVFFESLVAAMLLRGNGRAEKLMLGDRVVGLEFLHPDRLSKRLLPNGTYEWRYTDKFGRQRLIPANRIMSIPGFSLDGEEGVSVIQYGSSVFGTALAGESAANKTFRNGLLQNVYYTIEKFLKPSQRDEFQKNISNQLIEGNSPLLEGGIDAKSLNIKPVDAQLLESRGYSVEEICRWFRVPPWMIGHTEKSTSWGTGIEQQMIGFLTFTLAPWLKRIEQYINKELLTPAERVRYYSKFNVEGLLRADSAGRASFYGAMVNNGVMTRDEVRELEDMSPMGGNAGVLTVQSAMVPLDDLGMNEEVATTVRTLYGLGERK